MAIYAIGDIQGCLDPLLRLLDTIDFQPGRDRLWLTGDLVNRGPASLEVLRRVYDLRDSVTMVLGNHDLHLLAVAAGVRRPNRKDTLADILAAPDGEELLTWLRCQPLLHRDPSLGYTLIHAGMAPGWSVPRAAELAAEVEACLRGTDWRNFLADMYGDEPDTWTDDLRGNARLRVIVNYFTRMRVCDQNGKLNLSFKGPPALCPQGFAPWYAFRRDGEALIFGHWAALAGKLESDTIFALDTGCVWGGQLTALRLEDRKRFQCECCD